MTLLPVTLKGERKQIAVDAGRVELVLTEDKNSPLSLIMEPLEDLKEIHGNRKLTFSLSSMANSAWAGIAHGFESERANLERKNDQFGDSPTFLNRLANLARLSGNLELERDYLKRAKSVSPDVFFDHKIAENLISLGLTTNAEEIYKRLSRESDVQAHVRIAYFHVQRKDLVGACMAIGRAVEMDPLNFSVRLFEGALLTARGQYHDSIRSFRIAAEEKPNSSVLHSNLAIAYLGSGLSDKAFGALRRAIALDPLNRTAVVLLADIAFEEERNDEAIPALRFYAEMEQGDRSVWARFARALFEIGNIDETLSALKRQASIHDQAAVWNNLGVAYYRKGTSFRRKSYEAFRHALRKELVEDSHSYMLAAKNLCNLLFEDGDYRATADILDAVLSERNMEDVLAHNELSDFGSLQIATLERLGSPEKAANLALELATRSGTADNLAAWAAAWVLAYVAFEPHPEYLVRSLVDRFRPMVDQLPNAQEIRRNALINNLAYALIEIGALDEAEGLMHRLSQRVHIDPYPTATLGFFHFRRGHVERAKSLYDEAVRLAAVNQDKCRIKQKRNLELGKYWLTRSPTLAAKHLGDVIAEKNGISSFVAQASELRRTIR